MHSRSFFGNNSMSAFFLNVLYQEKEQSMADEQKYYDVIIPPNVRYDKRLTLLARFLYGEITALCNEKGFCWANNRYFAELYEVSIKTISTSINQLKELGYIDMKIIYKENSMEIINRYITICPYPMVAK